MGPTFVRWIESRRPVSVNLRTGDVMPLLHSATGLCFAAFLDTPTLRERIRQELEIAAQAGESHTPPNAAELADILTETRAHGMSRTRGTVIPNVNAFAAPVFDRDGRMVLAITTLGPAGLFDSNWTGPIAKAIQKAAQLASRQLGWRG
jgi:DNA-binding IclR family transcriptional regulator